jgi:putative hydrolase of the HAD superfamily
MPLRAVIFDYGEVLSLAANPAVHKQMIQIAALREDVFDKFYWAYRLDYDAGALNGRAYWEKVAGSAGAWFAPEQVDRLIERDARMWMDINEPMLAWHAEVKQAGFRTAILSNMGDEVLAAVLRDFVWLNNFDSLIWSCRVKCVKPHPAIYDHAIKKLGVRPDEALFIDNLEENIRAAEAAGLQGIVFEGIEQLAREIKLKKLEIPLPKAPVVSC